MKLLKLTLIYKLINVITTFISFRKTKALIGETFYSDSFKLVIKKYINGDLLEDWIGRLYCVINPSIDRNGNFDVSSMIIEIDGENTNNIEQVKAWVYKQMLLIANLFKIEKLYDYIDIEFKHVGPENQDNFLIIFDIVDRKRFTTAVKSFLKQLGLYIILAGIIIAILFFV